MSSCQSAAGHECECRLCDIVDAMAVIHCISSGLLACVLNCHLPHTPQLGSNCSLHIQSLLVRHSRSNASGSCGRRTISTSARLSATSTAVCCSVANARTSSQPRPQSLSALSVSSVPSEFQAASVRLCCLSTLSIDSALLRLDSCSSLAALSAASLEVKQRIAQLQQRIAAVQAEVEQRQSAQPTSLTATLPAMPTAVQQPYLHCRLLDRRTK